MHRIIDRLHGPAGSIEAPKAERRRRGHAKTLLRSGRKHVAWIRSARDPSPTTPVASTAFFSYLRLSIYLFTFICVLIYLIICLFVCLLIGLFIYWFICLFVFCWFVYLCICWSVCVFVYLFVDWPKVSLWMLWGDYAYEMCRMFVAFGWWLVKKVDFTVLFVSWKHVLKAS